MAGILGIFVRVKRTLLLRIGVKYMGRRIRKKIRVFVIRPG
jgi:hypothetical protein